jgi:23S rRNA pseudouridine1911/1915/1917 synthase
MSDIDGQGERSEARIVATTDPAAAGHAAPAAGLQQIEVDARSGGERLDKFLAGRLPQVSRSRLQRWITDGAVRLNGTAAKPRAILVAGDRIEVREPPAPEDGAGRAEAMELAIVFEDEALIVIDKPAGLVMHPGAGNWSGTLLNGLLAHDPRLAAVPRAGIVHRLDAGTSGLLVVARTPAAQFDLVRQLAARSVVREYWALAAGQLPPELTIDAAIGRDPRQPLRFRVSRAASARAARTHVRRLAQWNGAAAGAPPAPVSWIACRLVTGRTHQIRVHLESIGHPLLGDPVYRRHLPAFWTRSCPLQRQALHACRLELVHPLSRAAVAWSSAPPADMKNWMRELGARAQQLRAPAKLSIELPAPDARADAAWRAGDDEAQDAEDIE